MPEQGKVRTVFTGSFKPPHRGHLSLLKMMLGKTKKENGDVYVFISNKPREPCEDLTGEISKEIWREYVTTLPEKSQKRVRLVLSKLRSPVLTAYGFAKRVAKPGDKFYLIKSAKNAQNTRYSSFKTLKNHRILYKELILPGFESMHSTDMRKFAKNGKKKEFYQFLPPKLRPVQKLKIWNMMKKLCR